MFSSKILFDLLPILVVFLIFWFVLIVPMNRKEKLEKEKINTLAEGDIVVTKGGIEGAVQSIEKNSVQILSGKSLLMIRKNAIEEILEKK